MAPDSRMRDVAAQQAGDGRGREEQHVGAAVVAADETRFAREAGDVGLDCDAVAGLEGCD